MKIIVFDLDDTLYPELDYVKSGFWAVSRYLEQQYQASSEQLMTLMWNTLHTQGRGKVFDVALESIQQLTKTNVSQCVSIYRGHKPQQLELFEDAKIVLRHLQKWDIPVYIVTDGNKNVQYKKIKALEVDKYVRRYFITHRYGLHHSKPSPYCFEKISKIESVVPENIVYVGDNIAKDFVGIKPLGFQTVRVLRGSYMSLERSGEFHAKHEINSLLELLKLYNL